MVHTGALGALLTLARTPWYPHYFGSTSRFGIDALAGPAARRIDHVGAAGGIYILCGLVIAARWIKPRMGRGPHLSTSIEPPGPARAHRGARIRNHAIDLGLSRSRTWRSLWEARRRTDHDRLGLQCCAEALHSVADSGNEGLLLWGRREAKQAADRDVHPSGQGSATYFWSFIVALLLFSMGGVASVYEGIRKLSAGEHIESPWLAIGILIFAAVAEAISLYVAPQADQSRARQPQPMELVPDDQAQRAHHRLWRERGRPRWALAWR